VSIDEAYVDVGGSRYLCASVYEMAARIKAAAERETGLRISAGLGGTRMGAKLACEAAKPGGLFWLHDEEEFMSQLTLDKIPGVGPQSYFVLQGLGVRRGRELKAKYPGEWRKIFAGPAACGGMERGRPQPASRSFSRETTFPGDIRDPGLLHSHLAYLLDRLAVHLLREKLFAGRVEVKVRFSDFSTFTQRAALPFPTYSYFHLWQSSLPLLRSLLARRDLPRGRGRPRHPALLLPARRAADRRHRRRQGALRLLGAEERPQHAAGGPLPAGKGGNGAQDGVADEVNGAMPLKDKWKKAKGKSEEAGTFGKYLVVTQLGFGGGNDHWLWWFLSLTFTFLLLPFSF
jgi:hypothetical protein